MRVLDAFAPMRLEAEGALYSRRLTLVHELEVVQGARRALHSHCIHRCGVDILCVVCVLSAFFHLHFR